MDAQVSKANSMLGLIRASYTYLDGESMKKLFMALVRPQIEYSATVWRPRTKADRIKVEDVLRRATAMVPEVKDLPYEERLKKLDFPSMQYRHNRGDLIETWKFITGKYDVSAPTFKLEKDRLCQTVFSDRPTRQNPLKLTKEIVSTMKGRFITQRVINSWNQLTAEDVGAKTTYAFECRLDSRLKNQRYRTPYGPFSDYKIDE